MSMTETGVSVQEMEDVLVDTAEQFPFSLIVWNDEVNTFDWVIQSLMEVCGHTEEQAEQCALIIHFNGKYAVKKGDYDDLKPMCEALLDRGISATLAETVST
ncbi:ATP-dependent Clp protease adaptor ClpS [Chitinophaga lutea]